MGLSSDVHSGCAAGVGSGDARQYSGTVKDSTGVVPGATVVITERAKHAGLRDMNGHR